MRKGLVFSAILASAVATPALADDGEFDGPYAGISLGYSTVKSNQSVTLGGNWATEAAALKTFVTGFYPTNSKVNNVNFGGQIGYNHQDSSGLVLGVEANVSVLSGKDTQLRGPSASASFPALTYSVASTFDPKVTYGARGKLGLASGATLFYATAGWGWTNSDYAVDIVSNGGYHKTASGSHTSNGFEIGAGIEHKFGSNLSVRFDYTYSDQGDFTYQTGYATGSTFAPPTFNYTETFTQDLRQNLFRVGLNYHF